MFKSVGSHGDRRAGAVPTARTPRSQAASAAIKSAQRTLAVLEYFQTHRRAAAVGEIAAALGMPQSSTSMLLKSLLSLGYLEYTASSRRVAPPIGWRCWEAGCIPACSIAVH